MKISKIKINNYLHFEQGLEIDLTYPLGHPKAGEPLDKVCFLGQSGTGKTTLLNLVQYFTSENLDNRNIRLDTTRFSEECIEISFQLADHKFTKVWSDEMKKLRFRDLHYNPPKYVEEGYFRKEISQNLKLCIPLVLNFPFSIVGPDDIENDDTMGQHNIKFSAGKGELENFETNREVWNFNKDEIRHIWNIVYKEIESYISEYKSQESFYFNRIKTSPTDSANILQQFSEWESNNPNPIEKLAKECLNPILKHFNLEVEYDLDTYKTESSKTSNRYIIIRNKQNNEEVKYPFLSTGTKQVMLTSIPLFFIKPKHSIILFDQPETSLYPNIQLLLPQTYIEIAPDNQFVFATHSPIVASAFDPWEIVELKFNDGTGFVGRKEYYDTSDQRNVDNYLINPKFLTWDSNYKKLFSVKEQGHDERTVGLMELAELEEQMSGTDDIEEKKRLFKEYEKLANLLDWKILDNA
ncbi:MAG: ATP-binding protein [Chitinophagaceae bacterium]|nr:MAG: ATP-binding protein [Chitinophagaceae bacterium]